MPTKSRKDLLKTSQTRVFTFEGGVGPTAAPFYQGLGRANSPDWAGGDITPIRIPSNTQYGGFDEIDEIVGPKGLPSLSLELRMKRAVDNMLTLFQKGCPIDIQVHAGACQDPTDFDAYDVILALERARMTNWGAGDFGALDADQEALALQTLPFTGGTMYMIAPVRDTELGETQIVQEIVGVTFADRISCGDCGAPSDGSSVFFAVTKSHGGSPGLPAEVIYSKNGGGTILETPLTTIPANKDPSGIRQVGSNIVVISNEDLAIHYAPLADLLAGTATWTRTATGLVAAKGPNRLFTLSRTLSWIVGDGGYIYFSTDITAGATEVQTAGSITVQNLNDIHGINDQSLVAVGASNVVLKTTNGGDTWSAVTGPAVGVALNTVWMQTEQTWFVGTAGGKLYYTQDAGISWTEKTFSGSGAGTVNHVIFATAAVGYMAHATATPVGRIFRTIDGGGSWKLLPGSGQTLTALDRINRMAVPDSAPENILANLVIAGGLADDAIDGILLKIA